ncbi:hypothetical protein ACHHYP_16676, partial [Achlya hypogyna]
SRRRQKSSFFPDTEDDETSCSDAAPRVPPLTASFRMASQGRAVLSRHVPSSPLAHRGPSLSPKLVPFNDGAYLGAIEFPSTRSVLWDRRPLSAATVIRPEDAVVPEIVLTPSVLAQIHEAVLRRSNGPQLLGHVLYSQILGSQGWTIRATAFSANTDPRNLTRPPSSFPVYVVLKEVRELDSILSYDSIVHGTSYALRTGAPLDIALSVRHHIKEVINGFIQMRLVVSLFMPTQLNVTMELMAPTSELQLQPVRNLPLLLTPLAKSLMKLQASYSNGVVTLDKTRKMVPLLPSDPLATSRPLVGLWLQAAAPTSLYHQTLLYHTLEVSSQEQLWVSPNTCLLVKYPTEANQWLPEFFEATLNSPEAIALFTATQRVTVGRSARIENLELHLLQSHQPVPVVSVPKAPTDVRVHEPEPAPRSEDSSVGFASSLTEDFPTPLPRLPPSHPVARPQYRPPSPPITTDAMPTPQVVIAEASQTRPSSPQPASRSTSSSSAPSSVPSELLQQHDEQMKSMQRQIEALQNQLMALQRMYDEATTPKEMQSIGTNTSFVLSDAPVETLPTKDVPVEVAREATIAAPPSPDGEPSETAAMACELTTEASVAVPEPAGTAEDVESDDEPNMQYLVHPEEIDDYLSEPASVTYPLLRTHFDSDAVAAPLAAIGNNLLASFEVPRIRYQVGGGKDDADSEDEELEVRAIEARYLKRMVK